MSNGKPNKPLFLILLALTILDWIIPDPIPGLDEVILTVITVIAGIPYLPRQPKE